MKFSYGILAAFFAAAPAQAQSPTANYLIARQACGATQSIRGDDSSAAVTLETDRAYRLVGENGQPATHYLIEVPNASPERRWVDRTCGERVAATAGDESRPEPETADARAAAGRASASTSTRNILAISWQPAFCEGLPDKRECRTQTAARSDASRFSLHGLWPQPRAREYCGEAAGLKAKNRSADWDELPPPALSGPIRERLDVAMPGTQSLLDRHEWAKHGSCYGGDADEYFAEMIALLEVVNASPVAELFASRVGREVTADEIRAAFDRAFGPGAGERVRVSCRTDNGRRLVDELTLGLVGEITATPDMRALLAAARPTRPGCPGGVVDAVGLQ